MKIGKLAKNGAPSVLLASLYCLTSVVFVPWGASVTWFGVVGDTGILRCPGM